ncbi:ATP-binding protein [Streptomyces sp. NPDC088350]|uniref:ATP-binding protein n=1 Tax=Streptomyces sp. NPDC088350 TaxID=3365854 RepID=UPI0037F73D27
MPNDRPRGLPTAGDGCTTILGPGKSSVRHARELVRKRLAEYGLQSLVDIAELLVSELATNAVMHAGGRYRLTLSLGIGILRCEVADERRHLPRPLHRQPDSDENPDADSENGRGLFLVDALAHRWGSRLVEEGKEVWFELRLDTPDGTDETVEAEARTPVQTRPRPETDRTEPHHERVDHRYSPDGERTEDLGLIGRCHQRRRPSPTAPAPGAHAPPVAVRPRPPGP